MSFKSRATRKAALGAVAALSLVGAGVAMAPMASAASVAGTLSSATGPAAGGNVLTLSTATAKFVSGMTTQFQLAATPTTACTATAGTPGTTILSVTGAKVLSGTRYAFTVPSGVTIQSSNGSYNLCVYNGTSLEVTAKYTVATPTVVTSVSPTSGPALGGNTVTITGSGFPTGTLTPATTPVVKFGNVAALSTTVKVVNATTITVTAPAQAASSTAQTVSVSAAGGTDTLATAYTYKNGIIASPNFVSTSASAPVDIDISGVGFSGLDFTTTTGANADDANPHVFLNSGAYNQAAKVTECTDVLVISDNELICSIDITKSYTGGTINTTTALSTLPGTYTLYVVNDGLAANPTSKSVSSSGSTFTVAEF